MPRGKAAQYIYPRAKLFQSEGRRTYSSSAREAAFPLGGIGTGNISIGSRGEFRDWEIFNWPGKGNFLPFSFFALWARRGMEPPVAKILESSIRPPYNKSHGFLNGELAGLPRFSDSTLWAGYPFCSVAFDDDEVPVNVRLEAFTPFIPLNADDSGIPGAIICYEVINPNDVPVEVSVVGSLANAVGFNGYDVFNNLKLVSRVENEYREEADSKGLFLTAPDLMPSDFKFGSMALLTTEQSGVFSRPVWLEGEWTDNAQDFWEDFSDDGLLDPVEPITATGSALKDYHDFSFLKLREKIGSIGARRVIGARDRHAFEFVVAWHFPNRPRGWIEFDNDIADYEAGKYQPVRNYYATLFTDAWHAATYLVRERDRLESASRGFEDALFSSTLPDAVIDAVAANLASVRSHCCFRIEGGAFLGWEGIRDHIGCGQGNVNHVWNYAQTVSALFPELECSMRETEFCLEIGEDGAMPFRSRQVLGQSKWQMIPAADGQMGAILRVYREWKMTGDDAFLLRLWKNVAKAMDFAIEHWDPDGDGLPEARQSNTYDIEFYGPNPMMSFIYCAALKATADMARHMGDASLADRYAALQSKSARAIEDVLWNGEFFVQRLGDVNAHRYQHGIGCHADQLLGQFMAYMAGLDALVDTAKLGSAAIAVFRHNFMARMDAVQSVQRTYALNDEPALVLCSWPDGGRPRFPFAYCDEVWTGVEYQVACNLIYAGCIDEALTVVTAVRDRYDGVRRNPWSEIEAGHHYIRAMASFGLVSAFSGFKADLVAKKLYFSPALDLPLFRTFWSCGKAWGTFTLERDETGRRNWAIDVRYGDINGFEILVDLHRLALPN
jgi:non-lysosomal glucosylceramidase